MNTCAGMTHAMEVPEDICNPNRGLKVMNEG
jgi:hypothetical protein